MFFLLLLHRPVEAEAAEEEAAEEEAAGEAAGEAVAKAGWTHSTT